MTNRYRIIRDTHAGYEAQVRYWWFPFWWFQLASSGRGRGTNTNSTVAGARAVAHKHKHGLAEPLPPVPEVVEYLDETL